MRQAFCMETKEEVKKRGRKTVLCPPLPCVLRPVVEEIASHITWYIINK